MENKYELVGLFATKVNDILAEKTLVEHSKTAGFRVVEVDKMGVKPLAYPIKNEVKAYYIRLVIEGGNVKKLEELLRIEENVLRFLLVKLPKEE